MGLYDTFSLKIPIQCTNCYSGGYYDFQTKDIGEHMDDFLEGEPAVAYGLREINEQEKKERHEEFMLLYPNLFDTEWEELCGMFKRDRSVIVRQLPDGLYETYTYCKNCKSLFYVKMEVKNGIFVGVHI